MSLVRIITDSTSEILTVAVTDITGAHVAPQGLGVATVIAI